jgi:hypothetical protein
MNVAIAVITVGDKCTKTWQNVFAPSVYAYADRHSYQVIHLDGLIDADTTKPPQWQKLLLPGHESLQGFDRIVYLDSDVLCNPLAPQISETVPDGKVGVVTFQGSYSGDPVWYDLFREEWERNECEWIKQANLKSFSDLAEMAGYPRNEDWLNSGVMVYQPTKEIADLFRYIYDHEPHTPKSAAEQQALTHYLTNVRKDLLHSLDRRFNQIWYSLRARFYGFLQFLHEDSFVISKCVEAALMDCYFLHFASGGKRQEALNFMRHCHLMEKHACLSQ